MVRLGTTAWARFALPTHKWFHSVALRP
jgi:hypothetical protein